MKKITLVLFIIIFTILASFILTQSSAFSDSAENIKLSMTIGEARIKAELVLTHEARIQGLSGRSGLGDNEGMFFIFEYPGKYYFWMRNMNFPIDMIWIGEDGRIIYIKKDARPESFPEIFGPEENSRYVLEVPSGFSDKNNLKEGDKVGLGY